ncbi:hypothetical protein OUZ56_007284 [Daphnia magna]|uniref:Uncharacterized protein n=1 Tax=Daphnia magna TaxID=35525 RepID=A0ABQ9YY52_9CRUS|nr:hypothetical protein OUZ56_007284 [Daphnia magna]
MVLLFLRDGVGQNYGIKGRELTLQGVALRLLAIFTIDNEVEDHEGGHKAERTGGSDARDMPHGGAESDNIIILGFPTDPMLHTPSFLNEIMHGITLIQKSVCIRIFQLRYMRLNQSNELLLSLSIVSFLTDEVSSRFSQTSHQNGMPLLLEFLMNSSPQGMPPQQQDQRNHHQTQLLIFTYFVLSTLNY